MASLPVNKMFPCGQIPKYHQFRCMKYYRETQKINKIHWAKLRAKKWPVDHALAHFDYYYGSVFGRRWPSVRIALLSPHKYCAIVNTFSSLPDATSKKLEDLSALNLRKYYESRLTAMKTTDQNSEKSIQYKNKAPDQADSSSVFTSANVQEIASATERPTGKENDSWRNSMSPENVEPNLSCNLEDKESVTPRDEDIYQDYLDVAMNDFVPTTKMKYQEEIITDEEYYSFYRPESELPIAIEEEPALNFPATLDVYTFPRGVVSDFPAPSTDETKMLNYYLMNGASVLPSLVLGVNQGDVVGDLCAAPGGKALSILFSSLPSKLVCADKSKSRVDRMNKVFSTYIPRIKLQENLLNVIQMEVAAWPTDALFDKILLDVPCTNDRLSLHENDNNIFHVTKVNQRSLIPQVQKSLLSHALRLLKPDGSLVYSTCSLSPIQNDGVVHMALQEVWEETKLEFAIKNLYLCLVPFRGLYSLKTCRYGQLVVPFLPCNYGPMYICKITRNN